MPQVSEAPPPSRKASIVVGVVLVMLSVALSALVYVQPQHLKAPAVVAYVSVGAFGVAGVMLIATALGAAHVTKWLAVAITAALVFPAFWLAFGKGKRECAVSLPFVQLSSETLCRTAFGIGAVLGIAILAVFIHYAVSHKRGA